MFWFAEVHPVVALTPQEDLEGPALEVAHQGNVISHSMIIFYSNTPRL